MPKPTHHTSFHTRICYHMTELILSMLLFFSGIVFTAQFGFFNPVRPAKLMLGALSVKNRSHGGISPYASLFTALSGSVGTGNIVGIMGALIIGGAGSIFWILISAYFSLATKYAEVYLAIRYRDRHGPSGSPMRYIDLGLKKHSLAVFFALLCVVASLGTGNSVQANAISDAVCTLFSTFGTEYSPAALKLVCGVLLAVLIFVVICGGAKRISAAASFIVPGMSVLYVVFCLHVILANVDMIIPAFVKIAREAFAIRPILGGGAFAFFRSASVGIARGVFSHEAGIGSAPMAHAVASDTTPTRQGSFGMIEIVVDTFVICMATAIMLLVSGISIPSGNVVSLTYFVCAAFSTVFPTEVASTALCVCTVLFAFSSMISWSLYGSTCAKYLFGERGVLPYNILFCITCIIGASARLDIVWSIASVLNMLMALPNLYALFKLRHEVATK